MKLAQAIAESPGNKARAISDTGAIVIVQERYSSLTDRWLHVWHIHREEVDAETDIALDHLVKLLVLYDVDPDGNYWSVVK